MAATVVLIMMVLHLIVFHRTSSETTTTEVLNCSRFDTCCLMNSKTTEHSEPMIRSDPITNETTKYFGDNLILFLRDVAQSNHSETTRCLHLPVARNLKYFRFNSSSEDVLKCTNSSETQENARFTFIFQDGSKEELNNKSKNGSICFSCTYRGHHHCWPSVSTQTTGSTSHTERNLTNTGTSSESTSNNTTVSITSTTTNSTVTIMTPSSSTTSTSTTSTSTTSTSFTAPERAPCDTTNSTNCSTVQGMNGSGIALCTGEPSPTNFWTDLLQNYTWILIGFAAALVLMLIAKILICLIKCCRKKSPSGNEDDRNEKPEQTESKNDDTLTPHSSEPLVNASHHPPTYELVSESASPYAEVNGPDETTSPCNLYSEVALVRAPTCRPKSQAVKNGAMNAEEGVPAGSTTVKIEATENLYDDAATIGAALERQPIQTGNTSNNCEPAAGVEDTVAPVYCDVNRIKETPTPDIKDQKPTSPFAMNYANTIKSLAQKFKPPSNDSKAESGNDIYDDAAIVKMNDTKTNEDTQDDDADNVYQEASAVKLERLADSKKTNDAQLFQAKHSINPSKGNHVEHGTEMHSSEEDMTLVENTLYGEMKGE